MEEETHNVPPSLPTPPQFTVLSTLTPASSPHIHTASPTTNININTNTNTDTNTPVMPQTNNTQTAFHSSNHSFNIQHSSSRMTDGSEIFPYLWRYFLRHSQVRDWLMRAPPYTSASFAPSHISQGIAFCCNFDVPSAWADMSTAFNLGEMFVPDHSVGQFMCGSVVAVTSLHKHLVCALGPAASRDPHHLPSYRTAARRMVVDMASSHSINIIEFSWMCDGALIVTVKVLVPPLRARPFESAGCTGAFALFSDVVPGGPIPDAPRTLVSFVEVPRCPSCIQTGCLGCYCPPPNSSSSPTSSSSSSSSSSTSPSHTTTPTSSVSPNFRASSAIWPPQLPYHVDGSALSTYQNVRLRLRLIHHVAHVKITAHLVTIQQIVNDFGLPATSYCLGPSRFVVKAVRFRAANILEADTLRQVADKLRLLRCAALRMASDALRHPSKSTAPAMLTHNHPEPLSRENSSPSYQTQPPVFLPNNRPTPVHPGGNSNIVNSNLTNIDYDSCADSPNSSYISFHNADIPTPPSPTSPHSPPEGIVPRPTSLCVACVVQGVNGDGSRCAACSQHAMFNTHIPKKSQLDFMPISTTPVSTQCASPAEGNNSWLTSEVLPKAAKVTSYTRTPICAVQAQPPARLRCPRCEKTFSQQGSLNRHLKNIHDQRKIPCEYCMMTFGQMFDLKRHQRRKHADKQSTTVRRERIEARIVRLPVGRVII